MDMSNASKQDPATHAVIPGDEMVSCETVESGLELDGRKFADSRHHALDATHPIRLDRPDAGPTQDMF